MSAEYDAVFRTLVNDCPKLLIPFVNEVFNEHYPDETPIRFHPNEHFIQHSATPEKIRIIIRSPAGELHYGVEVVKIHRYSLEEIFQKKLLFLIPFYIFTHESRFAVYNEQKEQMKLLLKEYEYIRNELEKLSIVGEINEYTRTLMEMSGKVLEYLAKDYTQVQKGVNSIMIGKVLDYEAKTILNQGISQGFALGKRDTYLELLREGLISVAEVAKKLQISEQEVKEMFR